MSTRKKFLFGLLAITFGLLTGHAQQLAFPGALGFGAYATGGRGGTVYHVTTLADSGTGSFRDAVSQGGRIIVFDVGGYINLASAVSASSNLTIAGQTAPGGGIGLMGAELSFYGQTNIICRNLRVRQGGSSTSQSGINIGSSSGGAGNMIFDHTSVAFGQWDSIDAVNTANFTVQYCIIADPINQQFGAHVEGSNASYVNNLWVNAHNRQPLAKADTIYINNVVYNYQAGYTVADSAGDFSHDIINNYFITGPSTTSPNDDFYQFDSGQTVYASGNLLDQNDNGTLSGSSTAPSGDTPTSSPWSSVTATIPTASTASAYRIDVSSSGALPSDQVDQQVISTVTSLGTAGRIFNSVADSGLGNSGYGVINGGIPATDSDGDGMPDYWELAVGLNPYDGSDATTIASDGYANIEHYLNWLADPHAETATNSPVNVDLWQYTRGFTNASPVYAVNNASNGIVTLNGDGHTAQFTPSLNFHGLAGFQFSVAASDGSSYTNAMTVAVVPQSQSQTQPSDLIWVGDGTTNLWAVGSGTNWFDGTNLVAFSSGDNVTFDDTGANTPAIDLSGSIPAGTVYVIADDQDYTFGGSGFLAGPTVLFKTGGGQLNINTTNNFTGGVAINEGVVQVGDGANFSGNIGGSITNNDTLIFNNPGAVSSTASISGSGTLTKSGAGALTLTSAQTYTNLTTINAGSLQFSGRLPSGDIADNGSLIFGTSGFVNYSNTISGSGSLVNNVSGTIYLLSANTYTGGTTNNSGNLVLSNNAAAGSGAVSYYGGSVMVAGGIVITNDFSVPGSATSDLMMQGTNGTGIWAGNVVNMGTGAQWRPGADTGGQLTFTGNALLGGRNFIVPRGTVTFASNAVVSATGTATALGRDNSANNRSANVTIRDNAQLSLGICSLGGNKAGGSITVTVQNNAQLSFGANSLDLQNVARNTAVTTLRLNGGTTTAGGFTKTQTSYANVIDFNGGTLKAGAANAAFLPALTAQTNIIQSGGAVIDDGGFAIAIAAPLIHDPGLGATADGGLTKLGSGTLTLAANDTYTGPTIINAGTLALYAPPLGSISNSASIFIAAGAQLDVSGGGTAAMTLGGGKMLSGFGSIKGNFIVGSGAILSPGSNSIGALTFSNSLTLASGSTNIFEISHSPLTNDSVIIFGALTNGGALIITNTGADALAAGDSFKLFSAASYRGAFANVVLPPLPAGLGWNTNALNTSGALSVVVVTKPFITSAVASADGFAFAGTGGVANANFYLLGSTNVATPLTNWTRLLTNQFDNSGNFNFTNAVGTNAQTFYLLQLQ